MSSKQQISICAFIFVLSSVLEVVSSLSTMMASFFRHFVSFSALSFGLQWILIKTPVCYWVQRRLYNKAALTNIIVDLPNCWVYQSTYCTVNRLITLSKLCPLSDWHSKCWIKRLQGFTVHSDRQTFAYIMIWSWAFLHEFVREPLTDKTDLLHACVQRHRLLLRLHLLVLDSPAISKKQ